jgi:uncharacterized protein
MTPFQLTALLLTVLWLLLVVVWFRRSTLALFIGLLAIGLGTLAAFLLGWVTPAQLGLNRPTSWPLTIGYALAGLAMLLAYSPLADWLAARVFAQPPTLEAFGAIQQSLGKLIIGILAAWLLGGILEELVARGLVLGTIEALLSPLHSAWLASALAILVAAAGAGLMHLYQGPRAAGIITQLSILFGVLFVVSGHNLWTVMLCHGLYDTIAFVRFALKKSKYANLDK